MLGLDAPPPARAEARIPLCQISSGSRVTESTAEWCRRSGVDLRDTVVVSPIDRPNAVLTLAPGAQIQLSLFGLERSAPHRLTFSSTWIVLNYWSRGWLS